MMATSNAQTRSQTTTVEHESAPVLDVDDEAVVPDDGDSSHSVAVSSLTSLRSSVRQYQIENGRTYHGMSAGKYVFPNDDEENERLNLQHNMWLLTLRGSLCISPKEKGAKRVLDIGTGTGIWAIEYADAHPEAEVIGVDLSPIQPSLVPPNCTFEADDLEKDWTWDQPFDFIFSRVMAGSFTDYQAYIKKTFNALEPGGYLEMQDIGSPMESDDGTLKEGSYLVQMGQYFNQASENLGRPMAVAHTYKDLMEKAGFVDVVQKKFKWPMNQWPKDKHYKELGAWYHANVDGGLEGLLLAMLTRGLGFTSEEALLFCSKVRPELHDTSIHAYLPVYVVFGKKPEAPGTS